MSEIKMLPLPEYLYGREASDNERVVTVADAHAYAVRNVAHATEPLKAEIERLKVVAHGFVNEIAAKDAEIEKLRAEREVISAEAVKYADKSGRLEAKVDRLTEALRIAEAALADIGDADREPGDDVAWCERRAALGLRRVRDTLRVHDQEVSNG